MVHQKSNNLILNSERQLRNGWWILIFFLVLASILVPTLLFAQQNAMDVSFGLQAVIVATHIIYLSVVAPETNRRVAGEIECAVVQRAFPGWFGWICAYAYSCAHPAIIWLGRLAMEFCGISTLNNCAPFCRSCCCRRNVVPGVYFSTIDSQPGPVASAVGIRMIENRPLHT